ncbi:glutathione S-transferase family protein [Aspergillus homomorphus CBS 101889]|uniref:Putative glutathione S-transferase n=1 Tax=Aspergillus homomorphus (strain CBS 101889) TaxID=1450537 RepID=A0A395HMN4_ASPHC|nr:putative glutathione S-transferase [Aspergillus homomorphus CBS 101889]RAL09097.1 putative glutathione S-transferase [Aspergillus homomorphus CBS 101889]
MSLTIHHLHQSSSERVIWLCEELSLPYTLKTYDRVPLLAPEEYKALHPAATSPIIQDITDNGEEITLAESGACIEYISHRHASGRLFLPPTHRCYPDFLFWWHWVNGTFQPTLGRAMMARMAGLGEENLMVRLGAERMRRALAMLDERLRAEEWLAGEEFSVADVMLVFSLTTMRYFFAYGLGEFEGILGYLGRVGSREAYRRAMERADPGMELVLGADAPLGKSLM